MEPIKFEGADVNYRGPSEEVGDLWCMREKPGLIRVVYELDEDDRRMLAEGGRIMLGIWTEPIPPVSMQVIPEPMCRPVGPNRYRNIPELDDEDRR